MAPHEAERLYGQGRLALDVCRTCLAVWFDDKELLQLSPAASIALLGEFAKEEAGPRTPLGPSLSCPRCSRPLVETHDRQRNTKFWYHRCPAGHGRFMTSYQFLRAKDFVRALSDTEMAELRRHITQVNCGNCGAAVDIERDAVCGFCRTPIAIVDPEHVRKVLDEQRRLDEARAAGTGGAAAGGAGRTGPGSAGPDPTLPIALALERMRVERAWATTPGAKRDASVLDLFFGNTTDPIAGGLRLLSRLIGGM